MQPTIMYQMTVGIALSCVLTACSVNSYAGVDLTPGGAPRDAQMLAQRAREGDKRAQLELGIRWQEGRGLPRDNARALKLYRLAASDSHSKIWIYSPSVGKSDNSRVTALDTGIRENGLPEAKIRLQALSTRLGQ